MLPTSREDQPRARLTAIGADVEQGPPAPSEDWPRATDGLRGQPTRHGRQRDRGGRNGRGGCCGRRTAAREHGKTSGIELRRSGDRLIRRTCRIHGRRCGRGLASWRAGASPIAPRRPGRAWRLDGAGASVALLQHDHAGVVLLVLLRRSHVGVALLQHDRVGVVIQCAAGLSARPSSHCRHNTLPAEFAYGRHNARPGLGAPSSESAGEEEADEGPGPALGSCGVQC